ncbi:hypothetical protein CS542_02765 [Pedobacter sp. IW39]|nr:hypothetical protein CS542_02765 [Pedobacter sp. IW39]
MRTPLNAILGATEQLKAAPLNTEQQTMANLLKPLLQCCCLRSMKSWTFQGWKQENYHFQKPFSI